MKSKTTITLSFILVALIIFWACTEEETPENIELPLVSSTEVSNVTTNTAVSGGNITTEGGAQITARGVCWNTITNPTIDCNFTSDGTSTGLFTSNLTDLDINTTYYVRAYATNAGGTAYGNEVSFTTLDGLPIVTTGEITNIRSKTAVCIATISDDGGEDVSVRGVCWSTTQNPTIGCDHTISGSDTGSFTCNITDLERNTSYYVRAYASNVNGTAYGNELSFTTTNDIPILTTTEITGITDNSAISGGNITEDNGFAVTARGVCWSTSTEPTLADSYTEDGTGTGAFTSSITGLQSNTTYYVRSYATNSQGTAYGNEINFTTVDETVTDYDGNVYEAVKIGNQIWMAENLKTTHYADGTAIPLVTDETAWSNLADNNTDDAYCYYNNNTNGEADTYGALYTWAAAMGDNAVSSNSNPSGVQGACPDGWHLPSDDEWQELIDFIATDGYSGQEGTALKSTSGWYNNGNGTDIYGFNALPGGDRNHNNGSFGSAGDCGFWWSSTEYDNTYAHDRGLYFNLVEVTRFTDYKSYGQSVRCLKD